MNTRFATSPDSIRIAYDVSGSGPALMLLHGGGGSRQEWHAAGYVRRLKDEFTVIAVDMRGHGESDKPTAPVDYTTEKMGQDFLAVADACGFERFSLWGFSFGGNLGRYLAARSSRVEKMILIGNPLGPGVSGEWRQLSLDFQARWSPIIQAMAGAFDPRALSAQDWEDIQQLSFPAELLPSVLAWSSAMLDWPSVGPADFLCPVLWLFGSENQNALESYRKSESEIPGSNVQVRIFEGMTHEQEFENIEQVLPVILDFLKKQE